MTLAQIRENRHNMNGYYRSSDGYSCWVICGGFHNEDGPAIHNDDEQYWYLSDVEMTKEEWEKSTKGC